VLGLGLAALAVQSHHRLMHCHLMCRHLVELNLSRHRIHLDGLPPAILFAVRLIAKFVGPIDLELIVLSALLDLQFLNQALFAVALR
jgi:hypothetical protein